MKTLEQELRDWLRPTSALTAFYQGCRMEGAGGNADDPSKSAKGEYVDPLAGFDFDELPDDQRERLEKLQKEHRAQYDEKVQLEQRRQKAEEFARTQQSRADKLEGIVRKHNLVDAPPGNPGSADAKQVSDLQAKLEADGLKPEIAATYAKMLSTAGDLERQRIYKEMGPLFAEVGSLRAESVLANARTQYQQVFAVPELNKAINDNVAVLLQQGKPVDEKTVQHLVSMAWGQYALANPDKIKKDDMTQVPNLGNGTVTHGGHVNNPNRGADGAPRATQPETIAIMSSLNKFFEADLPKSGGKKK